MNHNVTNLLVRLGAYFAYTVWIILVTLLLICLFGKKWHFVKRVSKYLLNSVVFIIAFAFILKLALIVRSPVSKIQLRGWVNQHIVNDLYTSLIAVVLLFGINFFFYKKIEEHNYKVDLWILGISDAVILITGAWLAGQDAYFGLLEEINR
jgi:hypothetical protein